MKKLIIVEKPSVGQAYAKTLGVKGKNDGYIENDDYVITWCIGHLVTLSYPEAYDAALKKWSLDALPFLPKEYKYEVIKDVKKQFDIVKKLLNRKDVEVYCGGDSAREGELIMRLVFTQAGIMGKKPIKRIWIDSQTDDEIKRGIREAKDSSVYDLLSDAAYMRAIEDYAIGINLSRALSCKFGYQFNRQISSKKYAPIAVGRVMTCVLGMIVDREREIRDFKPVDFYKIDAAHSGFVSHWKALKTSSYYSEDDLYNESGLNDQTKAEALTKTLNGNPSMTIKKIAKKRELQNAPLLFNLAELQAECTKRYKISPDHTLNIAQELYEAKLTTYPRTDARVISTPVAKEIVNNIRGLENISEFKPFVQEILSGTAYKTIASSRYCDDNKISDHYAIIPTGQGDYSSLSGLTKTVYELIVKRFLAIFYPAAEFDKTDMTLVHECGEQFYASEKILVKDGFKKVYRSSDQDDEKHDSAFRQFSEGDVIPSEFSVVAAKTQPPKRYTSGSMILAMENAGKLIEDEELRAQIKGSGIGTSATRAATIKKLVDNKYISQNAKTQILTPTNIGEAVYDIVKDNIPSLLSPEMTANWEKGLSQIETGKITKDSYMDVFEKFVRKSVQKIKEKNAEERQKVEKKEAGVCPVCGKTLYETEKSYFCSDRKKDDKKSCQFGFLKTFCGKTLPDDTVQKLLSGKSTELLTGLVGKSGKEFEAYLVIGERGAVEMKYPSESTSLKCPVCGKSIDKGKFSYSCSCGFQCYHTIGGRLMTEDEMRSVFSSQISGPYHGFTTKDGNPYDAYLFLKNKKVGVVRTKLAGREFTKEEVVDLIENGHTDDELSGFISKSGKEFSAKLKLNKDMQVEFDFPEKEGKPRKKGGRTRRRS